ncbi:MAG TPA: heme exporter protein CcmD [Gammaproteobacteria bacterium]|nr:heme exporter protein CcmD [Gammaproteobacteria bacterium]
MTSLHEFLTMGGYGAYVWPAYIIAAVVMVANAIVPGRRLRRMRAALQRKDAA